MSNLSRTSTPVLPLYKQHGPQSLSRRERPLPTKLSGRKNALLGIWREKKLKRQGAITSLLLLKSRKQASAHLRPNRLTTKFLSPLLIETISMAMVAMVAMVDHILHVMDMDVDIKDTSLGWRACLTFSNHLFTKIQCSNSCSSLNLHSRCFTKSFLWAVFSWSIFWGRGGLPRVSLELLNHCFIWICTFGWLLAHGVEESANHSLYMVEHVVLKYREVDMAHQFVTHEGVVSQTESTDNVQYILKLIITILCNISFLLRFPLLLWKFILSVRNSFHH